MPGKSTLKRAQQRRARGQAPSTQASEFVREEMEKVKSGKAEVSSPKQAIAIGLSQARRAGVKVPARRGATSAKKKTAKTTAKKKASPRSRRTTTRRAPAEKAKVSARTTTAKKARKKVAKKASKSRSKKR